MELTKVKSSMIEAVGYDHESRLLEVVFKDGEVYHFENVPVSEYVGLMRAPSKGLFMHANILHSFSNHEVKGGSFPDVGANHSMK